MMNRFLTFACLCLFSTQGFSGTYCNAIPEYLSVGQEYSTRPTECTQSNRPSAICDVTLKRTATLVGRGSSEAILSFNVRTTDTENPHRLKGINIDLKGSTNITDITALKIYSQNTDDRFKPETATLCASVTDISSDDIHIAFDKPLSSGNNYFYIVASVRNNAYEGNRINIRLLSLESTIGFCTLSQNEAGGTTEIILERKLLFAPGDEGSKYYRIPALATAADGSLIMVADKRWTQLNDLPSHIDIVAKRSEDKGKTWSATSIVAGADDDSKGYGDPLLIVDKKTGDILCIYAFGQGLWQSTASDPIRIGLSRSKDNGKTWSPTEDITSQIYGAECKDPVRRNWHGAFAASGRGLQLKDGRLMFVLAVRTPDTRPWVGNLSNYVCYSDDGGKTWAVSENAATSAGDEAKLVELNNGNIMMSIRSSKNRTFSISTNRGVNWSKASKNTDLKEPACNGDILNYASILGLRNKSCILHSLPNDTIIRQNVSIAVSYDEGATWPIKKTICPGYSAYSTMTVLPDGTIGIVVEEGKWDKNLPGEDGFSLYFMRFSLDWITNGTDRYALPRYSTYYYQRTSLFDILPITAKDIVFLGNSITNGCEWHELLKNKNIKNRGISGDVINGINDRIDEILKGKPSKIFLMAGINDISKGHSIAEITGNIDKLVKKIKKVSPKTKLYLQSLLPVNDYFGKFEEHTSRWQMVVPINEELKKIAKGNKLTYVDVYSLFANSSGKMNIQYTNDGLHLLGPAYAMWRDLIRPYVEE